MQQTLLFCKKAIAGTKHAISQEKAEIELI